MSKGEKVALLIKTVVMFVLLGLVIFQNMRLDVTSRIASEIHYRFFYILSDKFHSQHLFEHISRDRDFDTFLVNYLAPSLFLGKDSIQNIEESKLFLNLADTRKEMLILDNMQLLSNFAGQYGWEVDIQEDAVAEGSQGAEGDTQAGGEVAADQTLAGLLDASGRGLSAEILPPNEAENQQPNQAPADTTASLDEDQSKVTLPEIQIDYDSNYNLKEIKQIEDLYLQKLKSLYAEELKKRAQEAKQNEISDSKVQDQAQRILEAEATNNAEQPQDSKVFEGALNKDLLMMNELITPIEVSLKSYKMTRDLSHQKNLKMTGAESQRAGILSKDKLNEQSEKFVDFSREEDGSTLYIPHFQYDPSLKQFVTYIVPSSLQDLQTQLKEIIKVKNKLFSIKEFSLRFALWNKETLILSMMRVSMEVHPNRSIDTHFNVYTHPLLPFHLTAKWSKLVPEVLFLVFFFIFLVHEISVITNFFRTTKVLDKKKSLVKKHTFKFTCKCFLIIFKVIWKILKFILVKVFVTLMTYVKLRPLQFVQIMLTSLFIYSTILIYIDWGTIFKTDFRLFDQKDSMGEISGFQDILRCFENLSVHFELFRKYSCYLLFLNIIVLWKILAGLWRPLDRILKTTTETLKMNLIYLISLIAILLGISYSINKCFGENESMFKTLKESMLIVTATLFGYMDGVSNLVTKNDFVLIFITSIVLLGVATLFVNSFIIMAKHAYKESFLVEEDAKPRRRAEDEDPHSSDSEQRRRKKKKKKYKYDENSESDANIETEDLIDSDSSGLNVKPGYDFSSQNNLQSYKRKVKHMRRRIAAQSRGKIFQYTAHWTIRFRNLFQCGFKRKQLRHSLNKGRKYMFSFFVEKKSNIRDQQNLFESGPEADQNEIFQERPEKHQELSESDDEEKLKDENNDFNPILYRKKLKKFDIRFKGIHNMIRNLEEAENIKHSFNDKNRDFHLKKKVGNIWRFIFVFSFFSLHLLASYLGNQFSPFE